MKNIILTLILVTLIFTIGCGISENKDVCIQKEGKCCIGDSCAVSFVECVEGKTPIFEGCNEECIPQYSCV